MTAQELKDNLCLYNLPLFTIDCVSAMLEKPLEDVDPFLWSYLNKIGGMVKKVGESGAFVSRQAIALAIMQFEDKHV